MNSETQRIQFVLNRDGLEATKVWARQTMWIYRSAVLDKNHYGSYPNYRRKFIQSYLTLKQFLNSPKP